MDFCVRLAALSSSPVFGSHLHRSPRGKKFNIVDGSAPLPCFSYLDPDMRKYSFAFEKTSSFTVTVLGYVYLSWISPPEKAGCLLQLGSSTTMRWKNTSAAYPLEPGEPAPLLGFPLWFSSGLQISAQKKRLSSSHRSQQLARFERKPGQTWSDSCQYVKIICQCLKIRGPECSISCRLINFQESKDVCPSSHLN